MTYTITDHDLIHYVDNTLAESGFDVEAIADDLRPYVEFGDATEWLPQDDESEESRLFWGAVEKHSVLIDTMLKTHGIDEDAYWAIVERHAELQMIEDILAAAKNAED